MHFTDLSSTLSGAAWIPLADAIAKATLLFAAAGAASWCLRRASAATRHLVWTLALLSALALPVLSIALPRWQLPLVTLSSSSGMERAPETAAGPVAPALHVSRTSERAAAALPAPMAAAPVSPRSAGLVKPGAASALAAAVSRVSWPVILLALWAVGAAAILGRLAAGHLAVLWMSRRTERVNDAPWLPLARTLAATLGISPRIMFLRSRSAAMPMAWGVLLPTVLMPADADTWPTERLRIVLLHELAHVKRRDCLTHMLAQIACALYWFNPLAWMAARHVRTERERACDDLVLATGTRGADYADQLIEVARVMRAGRFPALTAGASLAMAHRSQLEGRLMAILDPSVPRTSVGRARTVAAATVLACALMPLASLQPWTYAAAGAAVPSTAGSHEDPQAPAAPVTTPAVTGSTAGDRTAQAVATPSAHRHEQAAIDAIAHAAATGASEGLAEAAAYVAGAIPESAVQTIVQSAVNGAIHHVDQAADVNANVNSTINTNVNTNINTNINSNVNRHGGGHADDQDAKGRAADLRMVAALTAALKDTDKDVRETALHALVQLRDPSVFGPLMQALSDASPDVREQAAFGLGQMRDRRAVEPLIGALKDSDADVRQQAAFALGQLRDRSAVPGLTAAIKDSDEDVREQAVFALGQIRDPAAYDGLAAATHDAKADVRQQAVFSLGQLRDRRGVEPLISALKDAAPDVREQAAFALGQIRDSRAVEALVIALKDSAADVRQQVAFALGQIRDARAIDGLTGALKDTSADVRRQAAFALGQLIR